MDKIDKILKATKSFNIIEDKITEIERLFSPKLPLKTKILFIDNPKSGGGYYNHFPALTQKLFNSLGYQFDIKKTKGPGHASNLAKNAKGSGYGLILIGSGDGGIKDILNSIAGQDIKLSIIPKGTANILAKTLGLQISPVPDWFYASMKILYNCKDYELDVGMVNNEHFICWAGLGIDAEVIDNIDPIEKKYLKELAFLKTALKTLFPFDPKANKIGQYAPPLLKLSYPNKDKKIEKKCGYFVIVSNIKYYGTNIFPLFPDADPADGLFDIIIFKAKNVFDSLVVAGQIALRTHIQNKTVEIIQTSGPITIKSAKQDVKIHADCEIIGNTPAIITMPDYKLHFIA